ncbi:PHP domain-containing protein [Alkalihalobacillus trypoxylicola]|uniref:Polymerase/histidinol phosphatase N-terminal domain-containing protein n=1 Tax=Alkalihalobacillus trypoxylicola TaxID=519424 RepID=A0A161PKS1_9BACI|nr:PHP domain-containing protein [Alkalihalobacillus trypoxylicola]KYG34876.1 hypothetical protein AZF04_00655 [Alkalihalobacillus trypoxylicola]
MSRENDQSDLHMHSTASDGGYSPTELMKKCHAVGLKYVSLTDHDTVNGFLEAKMTADKLGMHVIPGIEFSTKFEKTSVHILGYGLDVTYTPLIELLNKQQQERRKRLDHILNKLAQVNITLSANSVLKHVDGGSIGRPHIAKAMVENKVVNSVAEAFDLYLAEGKPAYVEKEKEMSIQEAIDWIHLCKGVAIVAHPGHYSHLDQHLLYWCQEYHLDGLEIFHRDHSPEERSKYQKIHLELEKKLNKKLLVTGGSDFHHEDYGRTLEPLGKTRIDNRYAEALMEAIKNKR